MLLYINYLLLIVEQSNMKKAPVCNAEQGLLLVLQAGFT
jgi:hypothetical protein